MALKAEKKASDDALVFDMSLDYARQKIKAVLNIQTHDLRKTKLIHLRE